MTKRKTKTLPVGTCQLFDLDTSSLGNVESTFGFFRSGFLFEELNALSDRFQSMMFLESNTISNTEIKQTLQTIKKRAERFLEQMKPFLKEERLLTSKLYHFKNKLYAFLETIELIQSKIALHLASYSGEPSQHLFELGWPNRRHLLAKHIKYLHNFSEFHTYSIPAYQLEPLVNHVYRLEESIPIIEELIKRANFALERVSSQKRGKPERVPFNYYIAELARIYLQGTGNKPTSYWNEYTHCYKGDFLDFVVQVSHAFGFSFKNQGKLVKNVLQRMRSKNILVFQHPAQPIAI